MGQALRRVAGKMRASNAQLPAQQLKNAERRLPAPPAERPYAPATSQDGLGIPDTGCFHNPGALADSWFAFADDLQGPSFATNYMLR